MKMKKINEATENMIRVNIGGVQYLTSKATLCADSNSILTTMFSGYHKVKKLEDGSYFIDANGKNFGIILDYLRGRITSTNDLPEDKTILLELRREAEFYNLMELKSFVDICLGRHQEVLDEWFSRYIKENRAYGANINEFIRIHTIHEINFRYFDFSNCCFKNISFFHKVDFEGSNLSRAKFYNCRFHQELSFKKADLEITEFLNCECPNDIIIQFDDANLNECKFLEKEPIKSIYPLKADKVFGYNSLNYEIMLPFGYCIEWMSFYNARNIDKALFPLGKLELIKRRNQLPTNDE